MSTEGRQTSRVRSLWLPFLSGFWRSVNSSFAQWITPGAVAPYKSFFPANDPKGRIEAESPPKFLS
jgi:hypothetical protein